MLNCKIDSLYWTLLSLSGKDDPQYWEQGFNILLKNDHTGQDSIFTHLVLHNYVWKQTRFEFEWSYLRVQLLEYPMYVYNSNFQKPFEFLPEDKQSRNSGSYNVMLCFTGPGMFCALQRLNKFCVIFNYWEYTLLRLCSILWSSPFPVS